MGRLDRARIQSTKPEPGPHRKLIKKAVKGRAPIYPKFRFDTKAYVHNDLVLLAYTFTFTSLQN